MILHAFSQYLQAHYQPADDPKVHLHDWLLAQLTAPSPPKESENPKDHVTRSLQAEIERFGVASAQMSSQTPSQTQRSASRVWFVGRTPSGKTLLEALTNFAQSYDRWQFSRWLHHQQASDFRR